MAKISAWLAEHGVIPAPALSDRADLVTRTHDELTALRNKASGDRAMQNELGPIEHRTYVREETQKSRGRGAALAGAAVPYTMVKAAAQGKLAFLPGGRAMQLFAARGLEAYGHPVDDPRTSDASLREIGQAFAGFSEGANLNKRARRTLAPSLPGKIGMSRQR